MKFQGPTFGSFVPKQALIENGLKPDEIGMEELKFIWDDLSKIFVVLSSNVE